MSGYLYKYVGKYCVRAECDKVTGDLPRLDDGSLDPSFDDLYIDCKNNIKIKHGRDDILSCYIPTKSRGMNILRNIYKDKISKKLIDEITHNQKIYLENTCKALIDNGVLIAAEVLDYEVYFEFDSSMIDYITSIVGVKTRGMNNSPYIILDDDMELYKKSLKDFPKREIERNGESIVITDGLLIKKLTSEFDKIIIKSQSEDFDINKDRKEKGLKGKEYIHSFGNDMWKQYCKFLRDEGEKYET